MPSAKEIKSKMRGVRDTMKITKAMYMISTINMRKAKHQLEATEPYFYGLQQTMMKILKKFPNIKSEFFGDRYDDNDHLINEGKPKKVGYLVLSSDRGLAGAYNLNIFNVVEANIAGKTKDEYELFVVGELGLHTLAGRGYNVNMDFHNTVTKPSLERVRLLAEELIQKYLSGELDEIKVIYTRMINTMEVTVEMQQILPFSREDFITIDHKKVPKAAFSSSLAEGMKDESEYPVYPDPHVVLDEVVRNYVIGFLYGTFVEATACEENSRMTAMKTATDNAKDLLGVLTIKYNRVRQAAITQQITEISSGARALRRKKNQS